MRFQQILKQRQKIFSRNTGFQITPSNLNNLSTGESFELEKKDFQNFMDEQASFKLKQKNIRRRENKEAEEFLQRKPKKNPASEQGVPRGIP